MNKQEQIIKYIYADFFISETLWEYEDLKVISRLLPEESLINKFKKFFTKESMNFRKLQNISISSQKYIHAINLCEKNYTIIETFNGANILWLFHDTFSFLQNFYSDSIESKFNFNPSLLNKNIDHIGCLRCYINYGNINSQGFCGINYYNNKPFYLEFNWENPDRYILNLDESGYVEIAGLFYHYLMPLFMNIKKILYYRMVIGRIDVKLNSVFRKDFLKDEINAYKSIELPVMLATIDTCLNFIEDLIVKLKLDNNFIDYLLKKRNECYEICKIDKPEYIVQDKIKKNLIEPVDKIDETIFTTNLDELIHNIISKIQIEKILFITADNKVSVCKAEDMKNNNLPDKIKAVMVYANAGKNKSQRSGLKWLLQFHKKYPNIIPIVYSFEVEEIIEEVSGCLDANKLIFIRCPFSKEDLKVKLKFLKDDIKRDDKMLKKEFFDNRYKIIKPIDSGGFGNVYLAMDQNTGKERVLKKLNLTNNDHLEKRIETFTNEKNMLAKLKIKNIPEIIDFLDDPLEPCVVMEYIEGENLKKKIGSLAEKKYLETKQIVDWMKKICEIVEKLHNNYPEPIVFRDIKLENIMIEKDTDELKLIDFGIARMCHSLKDTTRFGIGSEGYSPDEQFDGEIEPWHDIYAIGVVIYRLLTKDISGNFDINKLKKINVTEDLIKIVEKSHEKSPDKRYITIIEMKEDLENISNKSSAINYKKIIQLNEEAEYAYNCCKNIIVIDKLAVWEIISREKWFVNMTCKTDIEIFFNALLEYSSIPHHIGNGYKIEAWVNDNKIDDKFKKARAEFDIITEGK